MWEPSFSLVANSVEAIPPYVGQPSAVPHCWDQFTINWGLVTSCCFVTEAADIVHPFWHHWEAAPHGCDQNNHLAIGSDRLLKWILSSVFLVH